MNNIPDIRDLDHVRIRAQIRKQLQKHLASQVWQQVWKKVYRDTGSMLRARDQLLTSLRTIS